MIANKINTKPAQLLIEKHLAHTEQYMIKFKGLPLMIHPYVFNPIYTKVSGFLAENLEIRKGEVCLEMFLGSGALALLAAKTSFHVVGIDISESAVQCARENAIKLNLEDRTDFRRGDMWNAIDDKETFDVIFGNPPLLPGIPETFFERTIVDSPEMNLTRAFITGSAMHIRQNGRIYMSASNACQAYVGNPLIFLNSIAQSVNLKMSLKSEWDVGYDIYRVIMFTPV